MRLLIVALLSIFSISSFGQISLVTSPEAGMNEPEYIDICPCDTVVFELEGDLSNVTSISWQINDESVNNESDSLSLEICESGVYTVDVIYFTNEDEINQETAFVRVSTTPDFSTLLENNNIYACIGSTVQFEGGFIDSENFNGFEMTASGSDTAAFIVDDYGDIPDNDTPCYSSSFEFDFGNTIISSTDQIENLFLNINHTYVGDLIITYTCPNDSTVVTHQQGGGGTNLGLNGEGSDYYWSNNDTLEIWADVGGDAIPEGNYQSFESFENFIGCPVSGTWSVEVCDVWGNDLGAVSSWGVNLSITDTTVFETSPTNAYWEANPWIIQETNTNITILQDDPMDIYTFVVEDNFGCAFSQDLQLNMNETIDLDLVDQIDMFCSFDQLSVEETAVNNCSEANGNYEYCYGDDEDQLWLYCPDDTAGNTMMSVEFLSGFLETNFDYIYVYDGPTVDSPLLTTFNGVIENVSFTANNSSGCILIRLVTDYSVNCQGNGYDLISYSVTCGDANQYDWSWEPADNLTSPNSPNLEIIEITDDFMFFTATVTDPNSPGCVLIHDVVVNTENTFDVGLGGEAELCIDAQGVSLYNFLNGTPSGEGMWLNENDEEVSGFLSPTEVGTFLYYYTSADCFASSLLTVLVSSIPETPSIIVDENFMITEEVYEGYQWYLDGVLLDGATNQSYTAPVDGNYEVEVFNTAGCSSLSEAVVIGEENTDNINEYQIINFAIYPNPFNHSTKLIMKNQALFYSISMYSITGELVRKYSDINKEIIIDKNNLEAGVYIIEVLDNQSGFSKNQRLIID